MDELCNKFNVITVNNEYDEMTYLEDIINESENLKIKNTRMFLEKVYWLLKRYKVSWMDDNNVYPNVLKGTNLYIQAYESKISSDVGIYILYCLAKETLYSIMTNVNELINE
mgnify:CR=1 FL=1